MTEDFAEIDFSKLEIFRGKTPEDIKEKCLTLCKDHLGGVWLKLSINEIEVKRLSGGFTNQLYYCAISKPLDLIGGEPQEVAIRLYGGKHFNNLDCDGNERLTDVIIALLASEYKLGPKIYGIFESGQIQKYYKHKQFRVDEQNDSELVKELAIKLARIHAMNVPIKKNGNWIFVSFDSFYEISYQKFPINQLIDECNCVTLKEHDLKLEIEWLKNLVLETNSPTVFCHNDFRGSNIMLTESDNNNIEGKDKLIICDFEYSSYCYRGIDFGSIFAEWGKSFNDFMKMHDFPKDSVIKPFIDDYIAESNKIHGNQYSKDKINSFKQLIKEVKVFSLVSNMFIILLMLKSDEKFEGMPEKFDKKQNMNFAEIMYKNYIHLKQKFIEEKAIENN